MRWPTNFLNANAFTPRSTPQRIPVKPWQKLLGLCLLAHSLLWCLTWAQDKLQYSKQAEFDSQGNIYVSSEEGKLIKMAGSGHCGWAEVARDNQTVGCLVMRGPELISESLQLEIFLKGGKKITIEPGAPIRDWHFLKDGQQVSVHFGFPNAPGCFALYESASGHLIEKLTEPPDESSLPQWAKTRAQLQDESVPMSPALTQERTMWIAKVVRQIETIKPGMRRKDLLKVFTTEGGLSNRLRRTYVHIECPYIKVDVRFKAANHEHDPLREDLADVIETISRPYLAWTVAD
jgi:hypothetical protein